MRVARQTPLAGGGEGGDRSLDDLDAAIGANLEIDHSEPRDRQLLSALLFASSKVKEAERERHTQLHDAAETVVERSAVGFGMNLFDPNLGQKSIAVGGSEGLNLPSDVEELEEMLPAGARGSGDVPCLTVPVGYVGSSRNGLREGLGYQRWPHASSSSSFSSSSSYHRDTSQSKQEQSGYNGRGGGGVTGEEGVEGRGEGMKGSGGVGNGGAAASGMEWRGNVKDADPSQDKESSFAGLFHLDLPHGLCVCVYVWKREREREREIERELLSV